MPRLRPALALALAACTPLALTACGGDDEPDVEVVIPTPPEEVGQPELLGMWTVTEADGATPTTEVTLQFTPTGEMIRTEDGRQQRATYTFAGDRYVEVTDAVGVTRYEVEFLGDDDVRLSTGGEDGPRLRLARRGGAVDLSTVPPPAGPADTTAAGDAAAPGTPASVAPPDTTPRLDR